MITISKPGKEIRATIDLTPSKSITNRALIISALSEKRITLENPSESTDSMVLKLALEKLPKEINVNDAGTAFRFLTAFLCLQEETFILTGSQRMQQRPIGGLVRALRSIGAEIDFIGKQNYPPLKIIGKKMKGGTVTLDASESSQYISALLMIAPKLSNGLKFELTGKINSRPYIDMTISMLRDSGIGVTFNQNVIEIPKQTFTSGKLKVENDWSSASFWYEIAALSDNAEILLKGLKKDSIQGDSVIDDIGKSFGIKSENRNGDLLIKKLQNEIPPFFEYDFSNCPDLVMPLAVTCAALKINSRFSGIKNLRIKESDRVRALKIELEKTGVRIIVSEDSFLINPLNELRIPSTFHSYKDHRMVMSLSPLALIFDKVEIDDYLPVKKSYPNFWSDLGKAGFNFDLPESGMKL